MEKRNVLLALMQLNIGGAETHVVELAKELKRKGYNVVVTSNGGVYVKELEDYGIKHYTVPMQNKKPQNMLKAARLLKRIITDEKIDIVHSHARIPSFILGKLQRKMGFPFVTTAHWVFNTKYGLKYITDWGQKTVAVSEDIKTYLIDNYKIPEHDIRVTINGIDTDKFSPDISPEQAKREFNISENENVITYVSRLDESRSLAAKQLIEAVPELMSEIENLRVILVGNGDDFDKVKEMADFVNKNAKREVITLTGSRTDINKLIAPCRLFVGVSRAALEAMAAEKPVIIAGNEGYIGLFDESKLSVGIDTNFCCRGCEMSSAELIKRDILSFFKMDAERQKALGAYGRKIIKENYSVSRMAEDTIDVYNWALSKQKEILISGYYGFNNSGDDALLTAIIKNLCENKESPNIVVLSANPKETILDYRVRAINRLNIFKIIKHMKKADMLISGGGTLIQDGTSTKSLWYYLAIIAMAHRFNLKVMLYSNGIGPLNKSMNRRKTRKVLNKVNLITLRDEISEKTLKNIGVTEPKTVVTADPTFGLDRGNRERGHELIINAGAPENKKYIGISVRKWSALGSDFEDIIAKICDYASVRYGLFPVFLPMQSSKDYAISQSIMRKMRYKSVIIGGHCGVDDMIAIVNAFELCIGMRLHSLIYAAINAVPIIGLEYDPKIRAFMERAAQHLHVRVETVTYERLKSLLDECMENYGEIKKELETSFEELRSLAAENGRLAIELYEKGSVDS